ncbi:MAG TPA: fibronectin type III domain-containing protein [Solirubrobacteraceae bacterium]|nr:fibronectin type III domain-containing protein [Solirubrobacteraceae bacterium]
MSLLPRPVRGPVALLAFALALLAHAPAALALPGSAEQVPLELRPSQGPAGSDTVLHAAGFTPSEDVEVYVDGALVAVEEADESGVAALIVEVPGALGIHRVVLHGTTSEQTAGGAFRTTATGAARTAFVATPRPMAASGVPSHPYQVRYLVANFPASKEIEGFYYWQPADDWFEFSIGFADADGRFEGAQTWNAGAFGVTSLAIGEPADTDPLLAADALIAPAAGYTPQRRVRAVPTVGRHDEPVFLLGSGFTAGGQVTLRELAGMTLVDETSVGPAAANGTVVARDDTGEFDQEYQLSQSGGYGAAAVYRENALPTPPTAAAALDLIDAGATTTVVAVGLTPSASVTLTGTDATGDTTTEAATVAADGTVQTTFTVPAAADAGPYEIEVGGASATLSVEGAIRPPRFGDAPAAIGGPPGGGDVTDEVGVCNDRDVAATVALSDDSPHVSVPASVSVPAEGCSTVTVTVGDDGPAGSSTVTLTATSAWTSDTTTFERVLRSASVDAVTSEPMDATQPIQLTGETEPGGQVRVLALPYGDPVFDLGTATADGAGEWQLQPFALPPRGSHVRFVAVPSELAATDDHSAYDPADGVRYVSRWGGPTDLSSSTSVFRDVGYAGAGVGDVFVLDPETSDDSFDGAAALEVAEGGSPVALANGADGGGNPGGVLIAERSHAVGATGVELKRRHEVPPGSRSMLVIDTLTNPTGQSRTFSLALVTTDGRATDDQELRLSTGSDWLGDGEVPAGGLTLAEGGAVPEQGYVALRDEDAADAATSGHGFVAWQQAPARVLTRPGRRDLLVLEYDVTVPAGATRELRHAIGATPTDASALATAAAAADTQPPSLSVTAPAQGATVESREVTVTGTVSDALGTPAVTVDGSAATVASDGSWSRAITLADGDGPKTIAVVASDGHGHETEVQRGVVLSRPPVVTTGDARDITQTGATVDVSVNPNGNATTYAVEYGTTSDLGSTTAASAPVTGTTPADHAVALGGLEPGTTYHYHVTATNSAGTRTGTKRTFTTFPPPGALVTTAKTPTSATLSGTVDPNGTPTTWRIEYGTTTDYGSQTAESAPLTGDDPVGVVGTLTGLAPDTAYLARLVMTSGGGTARGTATTFTTPPLAGSLTASAPEHDAVTLTGAVTGGTGWRIEWGPTSSYGASIEGSGPVEATLTGLTPDTPYHARLVAIGAGGEDEGDDLAFRTLRLPQAGTLAAGDVRTTSALLSGSVTPHGGGEWWIEHGRDDGSGTQSTAPAPVSGDAPVAVGALLEGLAPSTAYRARLAVRRGTAIVHGAWTTFTTATPPPPDPEPPGPGPEPEPPGPGPEPDPPAPEPRAPEPPGPPDPGPEVCGDCGPPESGPPLPLPTLPADLRPRTIATRGLALGFDLTTADCSPSCSLRVELLRGRSVVGRATRTYRFPGVARVLVRLTPRARRAIRRARRVALTVRATLVDGEGREASALRRVTLRAGRAAPRR